MVKRHNNADMETYFQNDKIRAVDAKYEAQKIAFGPINFQAARCLLKFGILEALSEAGETGLSKSDMAGALQLGDYALNVLLEIGLSLGIVKQSPDGSKYLLGKTGYFLVHDKLTRINMDFVHDVCYNGAFFLEESLKKGKPEGLKIFGDWPTIYEGLSSLPEKVQKSWFSFDHYYSDMAFPEALKFVFTDKIGKLLDIGGNTARWAFACMEHDSDVKITLVDLPGQAKMARDRIEKAGYSSRIFVHEADMLDPESGLPGGFDGVWMSQFLDCFSLEEVTAILKKVYGALKEEGFVYVMEPLWDRQRFPAAAYSLHATSLYFTTMANGNSKMYGFDELKSAVEEGGFCLYDANHRIGPNDYSILKFRKKESS